MSTQRMLPDLDCPVSAHWTGTERRLIDQRCPTGF